MNFYDEDTTRPARMNPNLAAQGAVAAIRRTPWAAEFKKEYNEAPNLSREADYDYRRAWWSGARPEKDPHDAGRYHWPSSSDSGELLKAPTHPTLWKEMYMRMTGKNPDAVGATIDDWLRIKDYANGGVVNPNSAGLAALGRGPDTMLVHMSPREVHGLQALALAHGGSLTTNPHTGLPEAGFLDSILPMVAAGVTAAVMPAAAPAFLPMLAGAGVGALTNKQSPLMGALMGGLSGYGFSGLGQTLGTMGAEALAEQAAQRGGEEALGRLSNLQASDIPTTSSFPIEIGEQSSAYTPDYVRASFPEMSSTQQTLYDQMKRLGYSNADMATALGRQGAMEGIAPTRGEALWAGAQKAGSAPVDFLTNSANSYDNAKRTAAAAAPLLSYGVGSLAQQPTLAGGISGSAPQGKIPKYTYGPMTVNPDFGQPGKPYFLNQTFTAAEGGMVPGNLNNRYPQAAISQSSYATPSQSPMSQSVVSSGYEPKINPFSGEMQMAQGGIAGMYAAGGKLLRGPGDGVSDSIPAEIHGSGGVQKAALADGEFVLPARIVSEIGNGSTEAGARKLYAMMDRIQKSRGKTLGKNVAANTKAERLLPA